MPAIFRGIISGKRVASVDLSSDPVLVSGKENRPETNGSTNGSATVEKKRLLKKQSVVQPNDVVGKSVMTEQAFDKLLDDLQIPTTLRPRLDTMDTSVKAAMIRSSRTLALTPHTPASPPKTPNTLRRTRSSNSLDSPRPPLSLAYDFPQPPQTACPPPSDILVPPIAPFMAGSTSAPQSFTHHLRGSSLDIPRSTSQLYLPLNSKTESIGGKSHKDKAANKDLSATKFCNLLAGTSSTQLDVETVKKLRLLIRNESASWTDEFFRQGGYAALLTRLNEILEVEWREEQHDDQVLHELLRCVKGLSTSSIGCFALRSSCPTPFAQLVSLLYSDKKPGDLCTRQVMVDLLLFLFELYPPSSLPATGSRSTSRRREIWEQVDEPEMHTSGDNLITLPAPHKTCFSLVRALLLTPAPPPSEGPPTKVSPHEFIESLHIPRIYKTYLQELSDICRDYFWVFCHPSNTIWNLDDTDETKVEKPRAPGGMTGGVEFEAMGYLTTHFRLINAFAKSAADGNLPKDNEQSAYRLHSDLFASGIERVLLIARKASIAYYPTLHLEVARYVTLAGLAGYELPWTVSRLIGPPPSAMCKPGRCPPRGQTRSAGNSPTKRAGGGPRLPTPKKIEAIKF
ncbi:hypothetical protein BD410DRAFT_784664 [Rickenella mellea]|uniref:Formin GTPase-binding domain-containing protein n=1 Tax=Rickenella mellea TaxID=50990 RepID=A0A4Y7QFJ0_9AGAM|nr:hypothetical protein BD410DRAFT_784664 [Rickenella mellea]